MLAPSSFEIEGMVKIQPLEGVEEKVLRSLGWTKLDFLIGRRVGTFFVDRIDIFEIQMYYEFGIFSTFYGGEEIPNWITDKVKGPLMSFTIPSSPKKLRGLNFCCVLTSRSLDYDFFYLPVIKISNITKNLTWIYQHYIPSIGVTGKSLTFLNHWMFGMNEMECGDQVTITVRENPFHIAKQVTNECGVSFVYDDGDTNEEGDVLCYYKSWNHIIGGDLSVFQLTTGEYILTIWRFLMSEIGIRLHSHESLFGDGAHFIDEQVLFRALSQRKSGLLELGP